MNIPTTKISDNKSNRSKSPWPAYTSCAALTMVLVLVGCETVPQETAWENETYKEWKQMADETAMTAVPAPEFPVMRDFHSDETVETALESLQPQLPQITVSDVVLTHEMDVAVLLRALADAADLNILISNNVSGPVLVNLKRETRWDLLFTSITEAHGLHYDLQDDLLRIFSIEDVERNIAMEQALHDQLKAAELRMRSEPTTIDMVRIHYGNLENIAASVRATMQAIVAEENAEFEDSATEEASRFMIQADNDSGQLIIHGVPNDIIRARKLIQELDQPTFQILIEATIVQANSEIARELGVQWGGYNIIDSGRLEVGTTPNSGGFNSNFPAQFESDDPGFIFGVRRTSGNQVLQAQLSALEQDGRLNVITNPSITTLDQQVAVIESGEERPFVSSAGVGIGSFPQIEFKKAVMRLEVTPHVIDENWVKLDIVTRKEEFDDNRTIIIAGFIQTPILTRLAETSLYLANGQTTVIGGLSSETESDQVDGIPVLKDLPGVGGMFRNTINRTGLNDTLIFITPTILPQAKRE